MDVIKTRLQVQNSMEVGRYKNAIDAFSRILKEEGPRAFTKGIGTRVLWITPGTAITIAACIIIIISFLVIQLICLIDEEMKKLFH